MSVNKFGFINDIGESGINKKYHKEWRTWYDMQRRVFTRASYKDVTICDRWRYFSNFLEDIKSLPGYEDWKNNNEPLKYSFDKDVRRPDSRMYSPETCMFILERLNNKEVKQRIDHTESVGRNKPVCQYSPDGTFIKEYKSARFAGRELNIDNSSIVKCCKNKEYKHVGGYIWKLK